MLEALTRINHCIGISVRRHADGSRISALSLSRKGNQLDLLKRLKNATTLKRIGEEFEKGSFVALTISGKGIVTKMMDKQGDKVAYDFSELMPGADPADFYIQEYDAGLRRFVSMIRKPEADLIIASITAQGFQVVMLTLAAFPVARISEQLNQYDSTIRFDGYEITRDEQGHWLDHKFKEGMADGYPIKIGPETIDEQLVLPYAAAFQAMLYEQIDPVQTAHPQVNEHMRNFSRGAALKKRGIVLLAAFFLLLLINTICFLELNRSNSALQDQLSRESTQAADLDAIAKKINAAEKLAGLMGYGKGQKKSIMIDQLAALMPSEIRLTRISVDPPTTNRPGSKKVLNFQDLTILINGHCPSILPVNEWLARVRTLPWLKQAELKDYGLASADTEGAFNIIIRY
ncbi:hypothetical protein CKK33_14570 [Mucilaginibacter sp. MD40]|uniref:hypothetical protein n=1 Tax=Mucilaginibacter sp. MD40 TaxID=2029590 RepID=UPI000BAC77FA|nr:hypothetical protein [Mucilaginibacter sp. MD40]PAW94650.1 hypothetical protein CKK33_14570 [Mucilaginibacter sp. MD40]